VEGNPIDSLAILALPRASWDIEMGKYVVEGRNWGWKTDGGETDSESCEIAFHIHALHYSVNDVLGRIHSAIGR